MPLYEYACLDCNERFEELRSAAKADAAIPCNVCGSPRVKRLLSVVARPVSRSDSGAAVATGGGCACGGNCSCRN